MGLNIFLFLVFLGKCFLLELLDGVIIGCDGVMSDIGYLNIEIFNSYIKNYFSKYVYFGNLE